MAMVDWLVIWICISLLLISKHRCTVLHLLSQISVDLLCIQIAFSERSIEALSISTIDLTSIVLINKLILSTLSKTYADKGAIIK